MRIIRNLLYDRFSSFIKFLFSERNNENKMSYLFFNEESDYSKENISGNEDLRSTISQSFQFEPEQKKTCGNESHEKETRFTLELPIYYVSE